MIAVHIVGITNQLNDDDDDEDDDGDNERDAEKRRQGEKKCGNVITPTAEPVTTTTTLNGRDDGRKKV